MYTGLLHAHSGLRWLVLLFLILAIVNAAGKMNGQKAFGARDKRLGLFALIFTHIQLLIGLVLYFFLSPKVQFSGDIMGNAILRHFTVEHISVMLIAIVLITVGYSRAKKQNSDQKKFKTTFWFYLIGLILILLSIPWPFRDLGAAWF